MARLKKKAKETKATIVFADESGFSLIPYTSRTWAPVGKTPIIHHAFRWPKFSAISAITTTGKLLFLVEKGSIKTPQCLKFIRHLRRHIPGNIILIWDNLSAHKSAAIRKIVEGSKGKLVIERLPPYAPELNPDELVWSCLKCQQLANYCPRNLGELKRALRLAVMRIRDRRELLRNIISGTDLCMDGLLT